jgi:hypothetical protein
MGQSQIDKFRPLMVRFPSTVRRARHLVSNLFQEVKRCETGVTQQTKVCRRMS